MHARRAALLALLLALAGAGAWLAWSRLDARAGVESAAGDARATAPSERGERARAELVTSAEPEIAPVEPEADARRVPEPAAPAAPARRAVVRGRVYDAASGEPWFGATVEARYRGGEPLLDARSDEDGLYRIELDGGAPARIDLAAFVEGRAALVRPDVAVGGGEVVVDFALPGAFAVTGRVLDARTGAPIAGAELRIFADGAAFAESEHDGFSDELGRFHLDELDDLPRAGLHVLAFFEEREPAHLAGLSVPEGAGELAVEIRLDAPRILRGRVVDAASGAPLADARVETSGRIEAFADAGDETRTADDGTFELAIGALAAADGLLYVQAKGYATVRLDDLTRFEDGALVRLSPRSSLAGTVLDAATREPLRGAAIRVEPRDLPELVAIEYTDDAVAAEDGSFELALENAPLGAARLVVELPGFAELRRDVALPGEARLELALERALVVRGTVTRSGGGEPLKGVRVRALLAGGDAADSPSDRTEKDGTFRITLPASAARSARWVLEHRGRRRAFGELSLPADLGAELVQDFALDLPPRDARGEPEVDSDPEK